MARELLGKLGSSHLATSISKSIGIPMSAVGFVFNKAIYDDSHTRKALAGSGIQCPSLETYAEKLFEYWEWYLDDTAFASGKALRVVRGKTVLITGASSGIGLTVAKKLGKAGARVLLVARGVEKLEQTAEMIRAVGGEAYIYPCDLTNLQAIVRL